MTQSQSLAYRLRWMLLILALLCWVAGAFYIFNILWPEWRLFPDEPKTGAGLMGVTGLWVKESTAYGLIAAGYLGIFLVAQWFFLAPRRGWRIQLNQTGRPLTRSVIVAALMAALLSVGLLACVLEVAGAWQRFTYSDPIESPRYWPALLALAATWGGWAVVFFVYWRQGDRYTQLGRMVRGLIAGSILETLVAAPVHVWVLQSGPVRERDCYCVRGSYTGLVFGGTVLLWAFGPGVVLLFLREKYRREKVLKGE